MTDELPMTEALRLALIRADPRLSRYDPLPRILSSCDFDDGPGGWATLIGNHDGDLTAVSPLKRDLRPAQLSTATFFDIGTHGSIDGVYSLKLATRPQAGSWSTAMKRLTLRELGRVRFETYFTFKAEQRFAAVRADGAADFDGNRSPSESDFGFFSLLCDVWGGADDRRFLCALRYMNTDMSGALVKRWMYKTREGGSSRDYVRGALAEPQDDLDAASLRDWAEVPNGFNPLCYNETATKINWHYLRWDFDIAAARNVELQVNQHVMDLREVPVPLAGRYESLNYLLNIRLDVRTNRDVRNCLYLDSTVISADW